MDPRSQPSKFVRSLIVLPIEEYDELVQLAKKKGNYDHPYEHRSRDRVFDNIAKSVKGFDSLRRESEQKRGDDDDDDDDNDDDKVSNDEGIDERQRYIEEFKAKMENFATGRLKSSFRALTERLLHEPGVYVRKNVIEAQRLFFPHMNFLDLCLTAVSQRKPSYILNLDKFIDLAIRISLPSHLVHNKIIRQKLEARRKKGPNPAFNRDDSYVSDDDDYDDDDDDDDDGTRRIKTSSPVSSSASTIAYNSAFDSPIPNSAQPAFATWFNTTGEGQRAEREYSKTLKKGRNESQVKLSYDDDSDDDSDNGKGGDDDNEFYEVDNNDDDDDDDNDDDDKKKPHHDHYTRSSANRR